MDSGPSKGVARALLFPDLSMFRTLRLIPVFLTALALQAATLQQLSMDQMSQLATSVVRARITGASASVYTTTDNSMIYTRYSLSVSELWKGQPATEVMLPGGDVTGQKQSFPGVPELRVGAEYILFLWKSPSTGITHTLGLSQGIFEITPQEDGSVIASRRQSGELMLDATGQKVADHAVSMKLADMKPRVRSGVTK
jgi:hypothetical protein